MDMIKQQLQRIQDQLGALSGTQRMLVFSLVTVMVLTVLLWSRYAATPDVVPLLNQAVQDQDLVQIQNALQGRGMNVRSSNGNLMVSPDDRLRALAIIAPMNLLPSNSTNLMDQYLNGGNPFESQNKNDKRYQLYLAQQLRNMILMMDGVREASVTIDPSNQFRFGAAITPTASVFVKTTSPEIASSAFVEGIANLVTGSVAGLKKTDVRMVINNRSRNLDSPLGAAGFGTDLLERQAQWEDFNVKKIRDYLSHIDGLQVALSVRINLETKQRRTHSIDDVKSKEAEINAKTSESGNSSPPPADPGVAANTGTLLTVPGAGGNNSTTEDTVTKMENFASTTDESATIPAGEPSVVAATVAIPRSYFVNSIKGRDPSAKEPDQNAVDAQIAAERATLQEAVKNALGMADAQSVLVTSYVDTSAAIPPPDSAGGGAGGIFTLALGGNMKEVLIGALALVSLFMLMMIVRKATPAPLRVPEQVKKSRPDVGEVDGNEPLIGIAASGNPTLEAMELGPEDMESQQVVDQVNSMVKEDPDAASQLIKRWLNRS